MFCNYRLYHYSDRIGLAILKKFIDQKVDIDCVDGQNRTPFIWAASTGYFIHDVFSGRTLSVFQAQSMLYVCCTNMERINYMQIKIV